MKGLFAWIGYRQTGVGYTRAPRYAGHSKWNYRRLWEFSIEGITLVHHRTAAFGHLPRSNECVPCLRVGCLDYCQDPPLWRACTRISDHYGQHLVSRWRAVARFGGYRRVSGPNIYRDQSPASVLNRRGHAPKIDTSAADTRRRPREMIDTPHRCIVPTPRLMADPLTLRQTLFPPPALERERAVGAKADRSLPLRPLCGSHRGVVKPSLGVHD